MMKKILASTLAVAVLAAFGPSAHAASGVWTADYSGLWSGTTNWAGGIVADGAGNTADFSTINLASNLTVTLDAPHTISILNFGDTTPLYNWTLSGPYPLTLGTSPLINVVNQTATLAVPIAGTNGLTKVGAGTLTFLGTNTCTGATAISNGVANYNGASAASGSGIFAVGAPAGSAVVNINTAGTVGFNGSYYGVGGLQTDSTDTGVGVINILNGTFNTGANNNYCEIGTGSLNESGTYGCINLEGGNYTTLGSSGIRVGVGGLGVFNQTGGVLSCGRYFAVGSEPNGGSTVNGAGLGVANFLAGTATISSSYRIILSDKSGGVAILNLGTEAGGTSTLTAQGSAGIDFVDTGGSLAKATLNLNSGTLNVAANFYHNNAAGVATVNWNGATYVANGNNYNLVSTANAFTSLNVYNGGVVINSQANTLTCPALLLAEPGKGVYPAGGTYAVTTGGGAGYLAQPIVTVTDTGTGSNVMAIASVTNGAVNAVVLTCPGGGCAAGDVLNFAFSGGGATTPATTFSHTLTAADLAANTAGGLTKLGTGTLTIEGGNTYGGSTLVTAGTLIVNGDGGLGSGNVSVANGATLTLQGGVTNDYIGASGDLVVGATGTVNLNYSGTNVLNALSLNGGTTYQAPGTYGAPGSSAVNQSSLFAGSGVLLVLSTPSISVSLASSINPSIYSQPVTFTATVTGNGATPTGTVTFEDGSTKVATIALSGGLANFTTNTLSEGSHPFSAIYNGNGSYPVTTSVPYTQTVGPDTEFWSGAVSGVWDIGTSANWSSVVTGNPTTYQQGDNVILDDQATGATAITLGTTVDPASLLVSNNVEAYSLSGSGTIGGQAALIKTGAGTLTVDVAQTYLGGTDITNGVVVFGPGSSSTGGGQLLVGASAGTAALSLASSNTFSFSGTVSVGGITGDANDTGNGAVLQTAGTVNTSGGDAYLEIGAGGSSSYGAYALAGGVLNTINTTGIRVGCQGLGLWTQSGGFLNCQRYFAIGTQTASSDIGGIGIATFTGGTALFSPSYRVILGDKPGAEGILNIGTEAGGNAGLTNLGVVNGDHAGVELLGDESATNAVINLDSGTLEVAGGIWRNSESFGAAYLNLNGGTLQAGASDIDLITNDVSPFGYADFVGTVFSRGFVVDSQSNLCYVTADLVPATGNGVYPAAGHLPVPAGDGGSGYIGEPLVSVSGGSGTNAFAVGTVSNGIITSVTMTCPGAGYLVGDTLNFSFTGGGPAVQANGFACTLQAGDLLTNATGGLVKIGAGQLILTSQNDAYTGATVVSNGVLNIAGSLIGGGAVNVAGGTLAGSGTIAGPVTVGAGGTLSAGIGAVAVLTIDNSLTLSPGSVSSLQIDEGNLTNDVVAGISTLVYGGTLSLTNLSGTLAAGDSFPLFSATNYSGSFSAIIPATPGAGLAWDTAGLITNGTLSVIAGAVINPNPTNITVSVTSGVLSLAWPADHTGWQLQVQTNTLSAGLGTNWVNVAGSITTNQVTIPVNPVNGSVFYRLTH